MSHQVTVTTTGKEEKYKELLPQLKALLAHENDSVANMANICAVLKYNFNFFWVGFYLVKDEQLVLGPFQGPVACTRIDKGRGVCGTAWQLEKSILVNDVEKFPGHIACSAESKSEIVIPLFDGNGKVAGVLDVDSDKLSDFDSTDDAWLSKVAGLLNF